MNDNNTFRTIDETIRQQFESGWAAGNPQPIEALVGQPTSANYLATLEELVHIELEFRWKDRDPLKRPQLEEYLKRFEPLADSAILSRLVNQEIKLRLALGETPTAAEYQQRFPEATVSIPATDQGAQDTGIKNEADVDTHHEMPTMAPDSGTGSDPLDSATLAGPEQQARRQVMLEGDFVPGYDLLGELGRGGMGVVYQARDQKLKRIVALKMILSGVHASEEDMQRFQTEAEAVAKLQHPNIVQIFEVGEHKGNPYISLEYQEGGGLDNKIAGTPQNVDESAQLIETLARAMQTAHQEDIIHRDLKPANILLSADGEPKITDFGLAKRMDDNSNQTKSGAVMGTPSYMAPEQAASSNDTIGPAADTYALGAILYHMLTGRPPFRAETQLDTLMQVISDEPLPPKRLNSKVPADLETICLKCLQKDIKRRYESCDQLAEDLRRFQAGEPIAARPVSAIERGWKWARRRPAMAGMIGVSIVAAVALVAGGLWYNAKLTIQRDEANTNKGLAERRESEALKAKDRAVNEREKANTARQRALIAEEQAKKNLKIAEEIAYASSMVLVNIDYQQGNLTRLRSNLKRYENRPDLQGFEWDYWNRLVNYRFLIKQTEDHPAAKHISLPLSEPWNLGFSADGSEIRFTAADAKNVIRTWDLLSGRELVKLKGHTRQLSSLSFSADLTRLASSSPRIGSGADTPTIKFWNTENGRPLYIFSGQDLRNSELEGAYIEVATVSADGKRAIGLFYLNESFSFRVWDVATGEEVKTFQIKQVNHETLPNGMEGILYPDANTLIILGRAVGDTQTVWVVDIETGDILNTIQGPIVFGIACNYDTQELLIVGRSEENDNHNSISLRKTRSGTKKWSTTVEMPTGLWNLVISPTGEHFAMSNGNEVNVGKMSDGSIRRAYQHYRGNLHIVEKLGFSPDGMRLLCGYKDGATRIWPVEDTYQVKLDHGRRLSRLFGHNGHVNQVQFSSDSRRLYSSSSKGKTVKIWDTKTHKEIISFDAHLNRFQNSASFAVSADDSLLAMVDNSEKRTIGIWDLKNQRKILTLEDLPQNRTAEPVGSIEFTKDGKALIGAIVSYPSYNNPNHKNPSHKKEKQRIKIWNVATGALLKTISVDQVILYASVSPDEKALLVYGEEGYVGLISFLDGSEIVTFSGHNGRITTAKFSPDGQRVATGSEDHTVRIWDVTTGDSLFVLRGHTSPIANIAFTPHGDRVASASTNGIVKLWDTESGFETLTLQHFGGGRGAGIAFSRNGMLAYSTGGHEIQIHDARPLRPLTPEDKK